MLDIGSLIAFAIICALVGFTFGRITRAPKPSALPPLGLSDTARAHIAYEAVRSYYRSVGSIGMKTWNNLHPSSRDAYTAYMSNARDGYVGADPSSAVDRIHQAIADL